MDKDGLPQSGQDLHFFKAFEYVTLKSNKLFIVQLSIFK